jgi:hypothetical protein
MGMFSLIKEAGEKLFGLGKAQAAQPATAAPSTDPVAALNQTAAQASATYIESMKLNVEGLDIAFDGAT